MIQYKKLQKLADHLRRGKLGHLKFDFSCINSDDPQMELKEGKVTVRPCGTSGCAMGELPILFPKDWEYPEPEVLGIDSDGYVEVDLPAEPEPLFETHGNGLEESVAEFFGISLGAANHLFYPHHQDTEQFGGVELDGKATKLQVAKNIEAFIAKMKGKK